MPKKLAGISYFAEQRRFNLSLQAQGVNFDQYLQVRGQTVEQFRAELHADSERKLRSPAGACCWWPAGRALWPTDAEINAALAAWDEKKGRGAHLPRQRPEQGRPQAGPPAGVGLHPGPLHTAAAPGGAHGGGDSLKYTKIQEKERSPHKQRALLFAFLHEKRENRGVTTSTPYW